MTKGTNFPAANPADRFAVLRKAQERHDRAVAEYQDAQRQYVEAVNALPLPELMQGPVVRVTDLDTITKAAIVLEMGPQGEQEADRLLAELRDYRAEREQLADFFGIADLAEVVAVTAAAVVRAGSA